MSLLNDILQQNQMQQPISALTPKKQNIFDEYSQQIAPKELAGMETRTPTQIAYDNLLNREAEINKQNKTNNFVSGLMSGIGGLGKVIANSVVSNPYQKAGAMEGIGEQETRLDGLRQAYDQARQQQNKDYVAQAREQLGLAREDEDKDYRRSETDKIFNYNQEKDLRDYDLRKAIADYAQKNADRQYNLQVNALKNKPAELTPEEKLAWEIKADEAKANAKAKREAQQDLNKANAEYESFKSNIPNLQDLSKKSGSTISRAIGGVGNLFDVITGKDTGITKPNDAMQEVKAQLVQAIFKANGIDGDKINKEQSKIILRQAGMPDSGDLSQSQVNTIIKNIDSIYKQRIAGKKNLANSFNSVSWE